MIFRSNLKEFKHLYYLVLFTSIVMSSITIILVIYSRTGWEKNKIDFRNKIEVILHNAIAKENQKMVNRIKTEDDYQHQINIPMIGQLLSQYKQQPKPTHSLTGQKDDLSNRHSFFKSLSSHLNHEDISLWIHGIDNELRKLIAYELTSWIYGIDKEFKQLLAFERIDLDYSFSLKDNKKDKTINSIDNFKKPPQDANDLAILNTKLFNTHYDLKLTYAQSEHVLKIILPFLVVACSVYLFATIGILTAVYLLFKQQNVNKMKTEFISNVSHELKTPVFTISLLLDRIKNELPETVPKTVERYTDISIQESLRLSLLIDRILKTLVFEKNSISFNSDTFLAKPVLNDTVLSFTHQIQSYFGTLKLDNEIPQELEINTDKLHLTGVVYNLIENAIKYSGENPPDIYVKLSLNKGFIRIQVTDQGIGISPKYQKLIFDKFIRIQSGNTHNTKGYGLGLSYVNQIVKLNKGNIKVYSQKGKGSTFIINWPY